MKREGKEGRRRGGQARSSVSCTHLSNCVCVCVCVEWVKVPTEQRVEWGNTGALIPTTAQRYIHKLFPRRTTQAHHNIQMDISKMHMIYTQSEHIYPHTQLKLTTKHTHTHGSKAKSCLLALCSNLEQSQTCGVFYSSLGAKYTDTVIKGGEVILYTHTQKEVFHIISKKSLLGHFQQLLASVGMYPVYPAAYILEHCLMSPVYLFRWWPFGICLLKSTIQQTIFFGV